MKFSQRSKLFALLAVAALLAASLSCALAAGEYLGSLQVVNCNSWVTLRAGGAAACVLNAANETACYAFLREEIPFGRIAGVVAGALQKYGSLPARDLADIDRADALAREEAGRLIHKN